MLLFRTVRTVRTERADRTGGPDSLVIALLAAVILATGCTGARVKLPFDDPAGNAAERTYALRYMRRAGTTDRYQSEYDVRVRQKETGKKRRTAGFQTLLRDRFESDDNANAEVIMHFTGKTSDGKFDRVVIRRRNVKREFMEVAPNGTVKISKKPGAPFQPLVTPNFDAEPTMRDLFYVPMDELGRIARRKETPFHYAWNDSLCYVFPIFPKDEVRVGDSWDHRVPVIAGHGYSGNVMDLNVTFTFDDLRSIPNGGGDKDGSLCAVIKYAYYSILDTRHQSDAGRLPPNDPNVVWRRFAIEGEGKVYFDIKAGKVLWKSEEYTVLIERGYDRLVSRRIKDRREKNPSAEIERMHFTALNTVKFSSRLLAPGERADERPSRLDR